VFYPTKAVRVSCVSLLGGEMSLPHLFLLLSIHVSADDGEPMKFNPLGFFISEDFLATQKNFTALALAITVPSPSISEMDEESC